MAKKQLFDASLEYHGESDKAIKVSEGGEPFWLPKSQIEYDKDSADLPVLKAGCVDVTMPLWLAQEKKLAGA